MSPTAHGDTNAEKLVKELGCKKLNTWRKIEKGFNI